MTITNRSGPSSIGSKLMVTFHVTFDSSYPTGGEALGAGLMGLSSVDHVFISPYDAASATLLYRYDYANGKILVLFPSGGAGTSPTTVIDPVVPTPSGSTAVTSSSSGPTFVPTPGQGKEVGSTANLASMIVRVTAIGN